MGFTNKASLRSLDAHRPKLSYSARARSIALRRERTMNEILSLRREGRAPGSFVEKALTLLTYGWSKATWRSREGILRTVDWLLRMERVRRRSLAIDTDRFAEIQERDN